MKIPKNWVPGLQSFGANLIQIKSCSSIWMHFLTLLTSVSEQCFRTPDMKAVSQHTVHFSLRSYRMQNTHKPLIIVFVCRPSTKPDAPMHHSGTQWSDGAIHLYIRTSWSVTTSAISIYGHNLRGVLHDEQLDRSDITLSDVNGMIIMTSQ